MTAGTKVCPRCAEDVKEAALVCKHCGHEFAVTPPETVVGAKSSTGMLPDDGVPADTAVRIRRGPLIAVIAVLAVLIVAALAYLLSPKLEQNGVATSSDVVVATPTPSPTSTAAAYEALAPGQSLDWEADKAPAEIARQAGPYVITITRKADADGIAPVVTVARGSDAVTMSGDSVSPTYVHHVGLVNAGGGRPPMVLLQSFSGGAHCCNDVHLVVDAGGMLKVVDLGSWDGDEIPMPADVSGDGVPDFVFRDNSFLYTFAAYAISVAPPKIMNVVDGVVVDVSAKPAYRRLFTADMQQAGETCRNGEDGAARNGSCAAFVADAARVGQLDAAWSVMLQHYAADADWENPTGCRIAYKGECPDEAKIVYKSYPEALVAFLKRQGYIKRNWMPPTSGIPDAEAVPLEQGGQ